MTTNKYLELVGMCSGGSCDVEDGLAISEELGQKEVELKGMNPELKSSPPPPLGLAAHP